MKKRLLPFIFLLLSVELFAQQHTNYTQHTLNRFALNPAVAGLTPCAETVFGNRRQWVGFDGAPNTYFATFNTRLFKENRFQKHFHGLGLVIMNDRIGLFNNTTLKFAYAYHLKLWVNYHLSFGIFGGIQQQAFNTNGLFVLDNTDPAFDAGDEARRNRIYPEVSPGAFIYNRNSFLGLSILQTYPARNENLGGKENRFSPHVFFTGGYRFRGQTIHYVPSLMINFAPFISPTVDLSLTLDYQQKISLALGSKYLNSGYATLQLRLAKSFQLGYSYEYAFNEIVEISPRTNEIVLRFTTCKSDELAPKVLCPAYH